MKDESEPGGAGFILHPSAFILVSMHREGVSLLRQQQAYAPRMSGALSDDIYTKPVTDPDTLANLGPLRAMAGVWGSDSGVDVHAVAGGEEESQYVERIDLQPIDPQTNGPQLFYGLRYHSHVVKPAGAVEFVEPRLARSSNSVASGSAVPPANATCARGIASISRRLLKPFLTNAFRIRVTTHPDGWWSYDEVTELSIRGRDQMFHHRDRATLRKIAEPSPNPLAAAALSAAQGRRLSVRP